MDNKKRIIKKVLVTFAVIIGLFAIINIYWFVDIKWRYDEMAEKLGKMVTTAEEEELGINTNRYELIKDGYRYMLKMPSYLQYGGFCTIGKDERVCATVDKEGNVLSTSGTHVDLYVWIMKFGKYSYGVSMINGEDVRQIEIDEYGKYIPGEDIDPDIMEEEKNLLEEHRQEIDTLLEKVDEMWGIRE